MNNNQTLDSKRKHQGKKGKGEKKKMTFKFRLNRGKGGESVFRSYDGRGREEGK